MRRRPFDRLTAGGVEAFPPHQSPAGTVRGRHCLSLREGAAGVEDGLDGFGGEAGFGVFG